MEITISFELRIKRNPETGAMTIEIVQCQLTKNDKPRYVLRMAVISGIRSFSLLVDGSKPISLNCKEYCFLKTLINRLHTDAAEGRNTVLLGWVAHAQLSSDNKTTGPADKSNLLLTFYPDQLVRGVFDLRQKLLRKGLPENFIETGPHWSRSYRLGVPPESICVEPA